MINVRSPPLLFSITLVLIVLLLSSYPILSFYITTYLSKPKKLGIGGYLSYLGSEVLSVKGSPTPFFYLLNISREANGYKLTIVFYNYSSVLSAGLNVLSSLPGAMPRVEFSKLLPLCKASITVSRANESAILSLILRPYSDHVVRLSSKNWVLLAYIDRSRYLTCSPMSCLPDKFLGYAHIYSAYPNINNISCVVARPVNGRTYIFPICLINFVKTNRNYILVSVNLRYMSLATLIKRNNYTRAHFIVDILYRDFGHNCSQIVSMRSLALSNGTRIMQENLYLYSLSFVPSDQGWRDAFIRRFNSLFPLNYLLLGLAALLVIARARKWL